MADKELIILSSFLTIGIIIISSLVYIFQSSLGLPILILAVILLALLLFLKEGKITSIVENLEKLAFIVTLIIIIISFIILYKPI